MGVFIVIVVVLLACVLVSRIASNDLREVAVAIEIMFSFVAVGTAISLPVSIMDNTKHQVLKEMLQSSDKSYNYLLKNDVLSVNYAVMKHRSYVDNFWIGIWYDKDVAKLELLK